MVPGAGSFKKGETGVPPPSFFGIRFVFCLIWLCKNIVKWVQNDRTGCPDVLGVVLAQKSLKKRLRPVQNDQTGCPDVLGVVLAQNSYKKL